MFFFYSIPSKHIPIDLTSVFFPILKYSECAYSTESFKIYESMEKTHNMLTRVLFIGVSMALATVFGLALIFPISYALFQYPEPDKWCILFELQWGYIAFQWKRLLCTSFLMLKALVQPQFHSITVNYSIGTFILDSWLIGLLNYAVRRVHHLRLSRSHRYISAYVFTLAPWWRMWKLKWLESIEKW